MQVDALLLNNAHLSPHIHHPEKAHNVLIAHADAAETGRLTEILLMICPVNIDVAPTGIGIVLLASMQPKYPGHHKVPP